MAHASYGRDFANLPTLADALGEAGYVDDGGLAHCRDGPHVRGRHVVDLVSGKS